MSVLGDATASSRCNHPESTTTMTTTTIYRWVPLSTRRCWLPKQQLCALQLQPLLRARMLAALARLALSRLCTNITVSRAIVQKRAKTGWRSLSQRAPSTQREHRRTMNERTTHQRASMCTVDVRMRFETEVIQSPAKFLTRDKVLQWCVR